MPIALFVLVYGMARKVAAIINLGLGLMAALCVSIIPVYLSGEGAEDQVEDQANVSKEHMEAHEDAGGTALVLVLITGVGALGTLLSKQIVRRVRAGHPRLPGSVSYLGFGRRRTQL